MSKLRWDTRLTLHIIVVRLQHGELGVYTLFVEGTDDAVVQVQR